jgi:tellurite resistance protein TerC
MIFSYFQVPARYQPRVLKWGILGALGMRAALILAGVTALELFHWMIYVFGGYLVITGLRMLSHREKKVDLAKNPAVKFVRRLIPVTKDFVEGKFFTRVNSVLCATPLFIVLMAVETSDLIFAVDSIPAVLAITTDPFIVYTSNVFALLGLRALYFLLTGIVSMFIHLRAGLSIILLFIGFKMIAADFYKIPVEVTLMIVVGILGASILASMLQKTTAHVVEVRKLSSR